MSVAPDQVRVRRTRVEDIPEIVALCREVYPASPPWSEEQLRSHQEIFPAGQFVALGPAGRVLGMAASLVIPWDDYDVADNWRDFTDHGMFTNHDPVNGRTLYGAEVMVRPSAQGQGVGGALYRARRRLVRRHQLLRIRAGARLRGYGRFADRLTPHEYVRAVVHGDLSDPTLSFQLHHGFHVIEVVADYLRHDPESLGYAAIIEWLNPDLTVGSPRRRADATPTPTSSVQGGER